MANKKELCAIAPFLFAGAIVNCFLVIHFLMAAFMSADKTSMALMAIFTDSIM
jgi:hypothetical protein